MQDLVKDAHAAGEMPGCDDPEACADVFVAVADGLVAEAALYPKSFSVRRQTCIVDNLLRAYGVDVPRPAAGPHAEAEVVPAIAR